MASPQEMEQLYPFQRNSHSSLRWLTPIIRFVWFSTDDTTKVWITTIGSSRRSSVTLSIQISRPRSLVSELRTLAQGQGRTSSRPLWFKILFFRHTKPFIFWLINRRIWLLDVSSKLPASAKLDGFDISPAQYPPRPLWPANVQLYTHNAFMPFPKEFLGKYDLVNLRDLSTVVTSASIKPLIMNLLDLLSEYQHSRTSLIHI